MRLRVEAEGHLSTLTEIGEVYKGVAHPMQSSLTASEQAELRSLRQFQETFSIPRPGLSACHSPVLGSWAQGPVQTLVS